MDLLISYAYDFILVSPLVCQENGETKRLSLGIPRIITIELWKYDFPRLKNVLFPVMNWRDFFYSKNTMNRHLNIRLFNGTITNNAQFFRTVREEPVKHGDQGHIE